MYQLHFLRISGRSLNRVRIQDKEFDVGIVKTNGDRANQKISPDTHNIFLYIMVSVINLSLRAVFSNSSILYFFKIVLDFIDLFFSQP
jgi:hypothetical protein